jgi:hypothetical protein
MRTLAFANILKRLTNLFSAFHTRVSRWIPAPPAPAPDDAPRAARIVVGHPVPYDENLLEKSRTQWQFGDWESLSGLGRETLQHHPDRAKLALLAATGHLQTDNPTQAKLFIRLAQDWGVSKARALNPYGDGQAAIRIRDALKV